MSTLYQLPADAKGRWYLIDISGKCLGRVASQIAVLLMGKHLPTYAPFWCNGDQVVVINATKVDVSGKKRSDKLYYHHTGYPGGIRVATFAEQLARHPRDIVRKAVKGMLPKNRLSRHMMSNLHVYEGADHLHAAQKPVEIGGQLRNQRELFEALVAIQ